RSLPDTSLPLRALPADDLDLRDAHAGAGGRSARGPRMKQPPFYGLLAEFTDPNELIAATRQTREAGYRHFDAYTPYPIEELSEAMAAHRNLLPLIVLIGGIVGLVGGYYLQYWTSVIDYPINVGGRPFHSWPSFIPVTFECTVLVAGISAVLGMLAL